MAGRLPPTRRNFFKSGRLANIFPGLTSTAAHPVWVQRLWLICILATGAWLRFYQLGRDSLWLDEAGVAYAARADSLGEMLAVVRSHVLAMPLDYLIVWLVGRFSQTELALRIPAALWGCLTLYLAYRFFRRFTDHSPALLGLLFLTLLPLHIQYSQEVRFYASLTFFYLLTSLLLWDALQQPTHRRWILYSITGVSGVFFHPYVLFSLTNGLVWLFLAGPIMWRDAKRRVCFMLTTCLILLAFLGGYLTFSASNFFDIPLLAFEESLLTAVATGLGWIPFFASNPGLNWIWGILFGALQIYGAWTVIKASPRSPLAGLVYSLVIQIAAVLGADLLAKYFFAPRQLLFLLPALSLLAGIGLSTIIAWAADRIRPSSYRFRPGMIRNGVFTIATFVVILTSLPALKTYYKDEKGNSRAIAQAILESWQPGDTILITPGYEGFVYKYYIETVYRRPDVSARMWTARWEEIRQTVDWEGSIYVITPARLSGEEARLMDKLGYTSLFRSTFESRYARVLWGRAR